MNTAYHQHEDAIHIETKVGDLVIDHSCIATVNTHRPKWQETAELIVRAVNSHEELLKACEELYALADNGSASFDDPEPGSPYLKAKAAIDKAKGE